jgi:hypothetical protein
MNWKGYGRKRSWHISRYYPSIRRKRQRKTIKNLIQCLVFITDELEKNLLYDN